MGFLPKKIPYEIKYILVIFFITRLILIIIGSISQIMLGDIRGIVGDHSRYLWLDLWGAWDTGWYLDIAEKGYSPNLINGQSNIGFFPLYPILMRFVGFLINDYFLAGVLISNICLVLACIFLYKLTRLDYGEDTSLESVKYLLIFPVSFMLSGVFSESLFLFLLIACFYYAVKRKWFLVGVFGFFLSLTRQLGVVMLIPLAYEYFKEREFKFKNIRSDFLFLLLIPLGLFVFFIYTYYLTGDFLAYVHSKQTGWGHVWSNPLSVIYHSISLNEVSAVFNGVFILLSILTLIIFYKKIRVSYLLGALLLIFVPLSTGYAVIPSLARYSLVAFPLFIIFAQSIRNKLFSQILTISFSLLQGFLMIFLSSNFRLII